MTSPFESFWMAGFESSDILNVRGERIDFATVTGHLRSVDEDYRMLAPFTMRTVRESLRWSQVEILPYQYDWSALILMIETGKKYNIQHIWDLCHFGFPGRYHAFTPYVL